MSRNKRGGNTDTFRINIGTIIFSVIFIYIIIRIVISLPKEKLAIYEVQNSYIDTNINTTALIVREETLVNAERSGYVSYYVRDGEKIGKDKTIYTIDETGSVYEKLKDLNSDSLTMSKDGLEEVRTRISNFENYFNYSDFSDVYNFRYDIENAVLELTNETLIDQLTSLDSNDTNAATYKKVNTKEAGIVTYYQDGYENFDIESFKASEINKNTYEKRTLKTGEIINSGDPVYKLITSENWYLIAPISEKEAAELKENDHVNINIHNSSKNITCNFELVTKDSKHFAIISLNQQMVNYINERYIDIVILQDQNNGLKIPNTAITQKKVYKIPENFVSKGSNSMEEKFFNIKKLDENGDVTLKQVEPAIYLKDDDFCYVDPNDFSSEDVLVSPDTNETIALSQLEKAEIDGVYCVNQGITDFRYIDMIFQDNEYTIVRADVDYSIARYDRLILNQAMVKENQIIK
ncbi:MAG: hypothetical protein K2L07_12945 [Lachnospiraceae bacterium]|nr:hypothetical protein [Lachnospiraceae bacterium]